MPASWALDATRCRAAGVPGGKGPGFATKPQLVQAMSAQAIDAGVPFA